MAHLWLPIREPDLTVVPTSYASDVVLMVSADHPYAGRDSICLEDLGDCTVVEGRSIPPCMEEIFNPCHTPSGRPVRRGHKVTTWRRPSAPSPRARPPPESPPRPRPSTPGPASPSCRSATPLRASGPSPGVRRARRRSSAPPRRCSGPRRRRIGSSDFLDRHGMRHEQLAVRTAALAAARRAGGRLGQTCAHGNLSAMYGMPGRHRDALGHATQALTMYRATGHLTRQARELNLVGCPGGHPRPPRGLPGRDGPRGRRRRRPAAGAGPPRRARTPVGRPAQGPPDRVTG